MVYAKNDLQNYPEAPMLTKSMTTYYGKSGVFSPSAGGFAGLRPFNEYNQQRGNPAGFARFN
jgi:hypothetical protein